MTNEAFEAASNQEQEAQSVETPVVEIHSEVEQSTVTAPAIEIIEPNVEDVAEIEIEQSATTVVEPDVIETVESSVAEIEIEQPTTNVEIQEVVETVKSSVEDVVEVGIEETSTPIEEHHAIENFEATEHIEGTTTSGIDYEHYTKADFIALLQTNLVTAKSDKAKPSDLKRIDEVLKEIKPLFDQMKRAEREVVRQIFIAENGDEDGFEYKEDEQTMQFEVLYREIKDLKNKFFQDLDKNKEKNFATKTELLQKLRELVEAEENNTKSQETVWNEFKKIQDDWKNAGNMVSPHNSTLWATFNALIDRFYSNRNIYFELKDLDRKKNATLKTEIVLKVEALAETVDSQSSAKNTLDEANHLFDEYKHIGPAPKAEQEVLWQRMKMALDTIYDARRAQSGEEKQQMAVVYAEKSKIYEELVPFTSFTSNGINEWNDKSKAVSALKEKWTAIKAPMLREEGKELSGKFWAALKTFFQNKSDFFRQLEIKREQHLGQKKILCEQIEAIVASGEDTAANTDKVIEAQKQWKTIGQVPEKYKDKIYDRFKKACDAYFNQKRSKNNAIETEFLDNLAKKNDLCSRMEAAAVSGETNLMKLNDFKTEWGSLGFVPRKEMQNIQKRYIAAVNTYVSAIGKLSPKEKQAVMEVGSNVTTPRERESSEQSSAGGQRKEGDIRRRMTALENDLSVWQNNIEFFARSKNSEKLKADFEKKIVAAQKQLDDLKRQLR